MHLSAYETDDPVEVVASVVCFQAVVAAVGMVAILLTTGKFDRLAQIGYNLRALGNESTLFFAESPSIDSRVHGMQIA